MVPRNPVVNSVFSGRGVAASIQRGHSFNRTRRKARKQQPPLIRAVNRRRFSVYAKAPSRRFIGGLSSYNNVSAHNVRPRSQRVQRAIPGSNASIEATSLKLKESIEGHHSPAQQRYNAAISNVPINMHNRQFSVSRSSSRLSKTSAAEQQCLEQAVMAGLRWWR